MRLKITHRTVYHYGTPVVHSIQSLRLTPRSDGRQRVLRWRLNLPAGAPEFVDPYGNVTRLLILEGTHTDIQIGVEGVVDTDPEEPASIRPVQISPQVFLQETPLTAPDDRLLEFAECDPRALASDPEAELVGLMARVRSTVRYVKGSTDVRTTATEVLSNGRGVCQDFSHLFIAGCRTNGVPARYVSGYYYSGHESEEETAMHAWAEAWTERTGWLSFDVSNGCPEGPGHLRLAVGRDYLDACPIRGVRIGGGHEMMDVRLQVMAAHSQQQQQQ